MDETDQNRLTEGSVPRKMLAFALPIFLSNLFQQLYNAVDSLIVGNFIGSTALAAVGSSASMIMLLVGFINGVSLGAGVVIARFYGADDRENLSRALHTTVALGIAAGLVLTVVGVLLTPQILRWMGTPGDVIGNSIAYFRVYFLGSSAVVLYNMCASSSPMKYLIFASLTNVVLDLLFVAVFRWGVASAALATILSQTLSALLAFRKLTHTGHSYRLSWRQVRFHGDMLRQVVYPLRRSELGHLPGQRHRPGQHQRLRLGGHGGLRCLQQNRGLCLFAGLLLFHGPGHLCKPEHRGAAL